MHRIFWALALGASCVQAQTSLDPTAPKARITIELLPQAVAAAGAVVRLGDIARLSSTDAGTLRRLMNLGLGNAPLRAAPTQLPRARIADWIRRRLLIAPEALAWSGAEQVELRHAPDQPLWVARQSWAWLETRDGPVRLRTRAQVLQNGNAGQWVRVRLAGASATLLARVVAPGRLELAP